MKNSRDTNRVANWHFKMPNNSNLAFIKGVWHLAVNIWLWQFGIFLALFFLLWQ